MLLIATGTAFPNAFGSPAASNCRLEVDDGTMSAPTIDVVATDAIGGQTPLSLTAVSPVLSASSHTFELSCNRVLGQMVIDKAMISAVLIGGG